MYAPQPTILLYCNFLSIRAGGREDIGQATSWPVHVKRLALSSWTIFCLKNNTQPGSIAVIQGWKEAHLFTHENVFVSNALPQLFDIVTWSPLWFLIIMVALGENW